MIISVASGKGGTGKTMVATSLAIALGETRPVQILDCDVEEPNSHIFIKPRFTDSQAVNIPVPKIDEAKCRVCGKCAEVCAYHALAAFLEQVMVFPELCHGCGACSYLCPEKAISEENRQIGSVDSGMAGGISFVQGKLNIGEAMPSPVIRAVRATAKPDSGTVIIDSPPGTSCPMVESIQGSDFCLLVTEPTPFGLNDLKLAAATVKQLGIPCGIVLNRAGIGDGQTEEYCRLEHIPIMLTIPLNAEIASLYSRGKPLVTAINGYKDKFIELFDRIGEKQ
ncbi:Cobyrinic acid ac-diamide synthase [Dehalogenimonas lykanthroporepellens BL-DC-9]|nr:Cobyrinic acid ac-diamide synthase [Dehalogenimonas lykanthroporepellens BL-DC-9]